MTNRLWINDHYFLYAASCKRSSIIDYPLPLKELNEQVFSFLIIISNTCTTLHTHVASWYEYFAIMMQNLHTWNLLLYVSTTWPSNIWGPETAYSDKHFCEDKASNFKASMVKDVASMTWNLQELQWCLPSLEVPHNNRLCSPKGDYIYGLASPVSFFFLYLPRNKSVCIFLSLVLYDLLITYLVLWSEQSNS